MRTGGCVPGVYGFQPELAEGHINVGSLFICAAPFSCRWGFRRRIPSGQGEDEDWSGRKVWSGGHIAIDHAPGLTGLSKKMNPCSKIQTASYDKCTLDLIYPAG